MLELAFYRGNGNNFDKLIRWWTDSDYSHVEIVINGVGYSSSPRDGGVRKANINFGNGNWDMFEIPCTYLQEEKIRLFFEREMWKKYDWLGIFLTQAIPIGTQDPLRWFCSEIAMAAFYHAEITTIENKPKWYSPEDMYRKIILKNDIIIQ